jgi:geranylgeranyl diphosphate synthase type II
MINELINSYKTVFEAEIDKLLPLKEYPYNEVLKAARYSLLLGGKRIRPIITAEFCRLAGGKPEDSYNFAVALEMIHTYSLIHDDLPCMDNDDMRRGKPSCHKAFGEDTALLAGDTLLTEAFNILSKANLPSDRIVKAVEFLSHHAGLHGMIGGQVLDLQFEDTKPDAAQLIDMYSRKTSGLLIAAAQLGLIAAGKTDSESIINANNYARDLGIAFQIIDDILDCTADENVLGKPVGSDEKNNKTTFVTLFGLEKAKEFAKQFTQSALDSLNKFDGDKTNLKALTEYLLKREF